jgi:hypothetical protein
VVGAITAAGVPAAETDAAHDTCAEISGCVVGATTNTGTVTSIATTAPITGGTITTTGTIACATCATSAAALTANAVVIGGGSQATSTISASTTTTHALFATATAPAFRAIADADVPDSITVTLAAGATALAADPADCSANTWATTIAASGALTCSAISGGAGITDGTIVNADLDVAGEAWDWGGATSTEIVNGTGPTVDAAGEIAVDTTASQLVYYGASAAKIIDPRQTLSLVLLSPVDADTPFIFKAPYGMTITAINCIVGAATSAVIDVQECSATGTGCATVDATITCDADGAADDGSLSNSSIDANDWIKLDIGTVTGTVLAVTVTISYVVVAE